MWMTHFFLYTCVTLPSRPCMSTHAHYYLLLMCLGERSRHVLALSLPMGLSQAPHLEGATNDLHLVILTDWDSPDLQHIPDQLLASAAAESA